MQAEIIPWLRGQVSVDKRFVGTVQDDARMLRFVNSHDGPRLAELGTSCPDHFLRTKIKPLFVDWDPSSRDVEALKDLLAEGMVEYRKNYEAYYQKCKRPDSPAMRDPNPTVVLIPGLGMIAWGKNKSESRVTAEFYNCAIEVMRGAEAIDQYEAMDQQEAFDIEYWPLEEAKLRRMPPEKELDRQIIVVIGAGAGIGKATAHRLVKEGAHIGCVDLDEAAAKEMAQEMAVEMAPLVRVNAVAPATVVKGSTMFPRDRVIASLTKYDIAFSEEESTDELREKLAAFYAKRSLTQTPIEPEDQAEAIFLLVSPRLSKTTGHVIPVDGGLQDGFLR